MFGSLTGLAPSMLEFGSQKSAKPTFQHLKKFSKSCSTDSADSPTLGRHNSRLVEN